MVQGKDHDGRVKRKGEVSLGLKKDFCKEYKATRSGSSCETPPEMEEAIESALERALIRMRIRYKPMLDHLGLPISILDEWLFDTPEDKESQQRDQSTSGGTLHELQLQKPVQTHSQSLRRDLEVCSYNFVFRPTTETFM